MTPPTPRELRALSVVDRFGGRARRWARALTESDRLGDAVADRIAADPGQLGALHRSLASGQATPDAGPELRALLDSVAELPPGVDRAALERGGRLFFRTGAAGGMALGSGSLVGGYGSPEGNKPLVHSRRLLDDVSRRIAETATFVVETHRAGGVLPGGAGWRLGLHVRVMHAVVRRRLLHDPGWRADWGLPINQHDLGATQLLFSMAWVEAVRRLGWRVTRAEAEDHLALWRVAGAWMGVDPDLVAHDEPDALASIAFLEATEGTPDADSRALVRALLDSSPPGPARPLRLAFAEAVLGHVQGPARAGPLGLSVSPARLLVPLVTAPNGPLSAVSRRSRRVEAMLVAAGERYWRTTGGAGVHEPIAR